MALSIEEAPYQTEAPNSGFLIDDPDPKRLKQLLEEEDIEHYLRLRDKAE